MAAESVEIRMARLEGGNAQINERLGAIEHRIGALEQRIVAEIGSVRGEIGDLRRQLNTQFYWLLTLILGSILIPLLRDLAR